MSRLLGKKEQKKKIKKASKVLLTSLLICFIPLKVFKAILTSDLKANGTLVSMLKNCELQQQKSDY